VWWMEKHERWWCNKVRGVYGTMMAERTEQRHEKTVKLCNKKLAQKNDSKVCTKQWQEGLDLRTKANCNYGDGKNWLKIDCVVDRLLLVLNTKSSYSKKFR
jgi:hypothetical protein